MKLRWRFQVSENGFTIIEVLIAIFIGLIVLGVLYASFFQIMKAKDMVENELETYHEARVVFSKLTEDLSGVFERGKVYSSSSSRSRSGSSALSAAGASPASPNLVVSLDDVEHRAFLGLKDGENNKMIFTSLSGNTAGNANYPDQAVITYELEPIPESDLFVLIRSENPSFRNDSGAIRYPISENVVGFELAYITNGETGEEFTEEWDSALAGSVPKAVDVTLIIRDIRGEDVVFNTLILIPAGN